MSGISFGELMILALVGLLVLGPERLPRVANQLGSWLGQARRMTRVMKRQLEDELKFEKELGLKKAFTAEPAVSKPQYVHNKTVEQDDEYSPEHGPDSVGSGINDNQDDADNETASPEVTASPLPSDGETENTDSKKKTPA